MNGVFSILSLMAFIILCINAAVTYRKLWIMEVNQDLQLELLMSMHSRLNKEVIKQFDTASRTKKQLELDLDIPTQLTRNK